MIEDVLNKLDNNEYCELDINELRILYEIDEVSNISLKDYIEYRDKYNDFCKMFGSSHIACSSDEITIDTIAYIGNLFIDRKMPTYNLRYVVGSLSIAIKENLENLENVYNYLFISDNEYYKVLSNLKMVNYLCISSLEKNVDLSLIEKIDTLDINVNSLKNNKYPTILNSLNINVRDNNYFFPDNIKNLEIRYLKDAKGLILPDDLESLKIDGLESAKGLVLPSNLKELYLRHLKVTKYLRLNNGLEVLELSNIKSLDGLIFPDSIRKLDIRSVLSLEDFIKPKNIEELYINNMGMTKDYNLNDIDVLRFDRVDANKIKKHK